jgi:hypothetical protein
VEITLVDETTAVNILAQFTDAVVPALLEAAWWLSILWVSRLVWLPLLLPM